MPGYLQLVPTGQGPLQCRGRFFERSVVRLVVNFYLKERNRLKSNNL
jgi:hypothetical protein